MDDLERAYRRLKALPYPSVPDDETLAEIVTRMSELDAELSALAGRGGRGERIFPDQVPPLRELVVRLRGLDEDLSERDAGIFVSAVEYLEALSELRDALLKPAV